MGDGPCGPCTEIFYDLSGKGISSDEKLTIQDLDNKRFIEIGNIVFSEFYHKGEDYSPLAQKCVFATVITANSLNLFTELSFNMVKKCAKSDGSVEIF
jgi:hypothetical protein